MGLFALAFTGGALLLMGIWECLTVTFRTPLKSNLSLNFTPRFSTVTLVSAASLSVLFMIDSCLSLFDALSHNDKMGSALQLQVLAISSLFLMFSVLGLFAKLSKWYNLPYSLMGLILLFGFMEEFLLFYLQMKDPNGIENRYFDLLLVPIAICVFSTVIELKSPESNMPRLARGVGLILHGNWLIQMGLSFYTGLIAHNCGFHQKSRGNYTIKCKGHMDSHRAGAIAVLLFNCHLAFLVAVIAGVYSVVGKNYAAVADYANYRPLGAETQRVMDNQGQFTLDSDSDDGGINEIKEEGGNASRQHGGAVELTVNGYGAHQ